MLDGDSQMTHDSILDFTRELQCRVKNQSYQQTKKSQLKA